jgi:hypothetical protein
MGNGGISDIYTLTNKKIAIPCLRLMSIHSGKNMAKVFMAKVFNFETLSQFYANKWDNSAEISDYSS